MMEILRRLVALVCLVMTIGTALAPQPALLRFGPIDFAHEQKESWFEDERQLALEDFIAQETEGRLLSVQGSAWTTFFGEFADAVSGRFAAWQGRLNVGWSAGSRVYFRPDEPPASEIARAVDANGGFSYLALAGPTGAQYLTATYARPRDMLDDAPADLLYPLRRYSLWFLLAGLAVYVVLPRRKRDSGALAYSTVRAVILPDLVGLLLAGVFFALPFLIVPSNSSSADVLDPDGGWIVLTLVCWMFAVGGVVIVGVAARYAAFSIVPGNDGLDVTSWRGRARYRYADMQVARPYARRASKGLIGLGVLATLLNWRAAAPTLALASSDSSGLEIVFRDGRTWRVMADALNGFDRLVGILRDNGVAVDPALEQWVGRSGDSEDEP